MSKKRKETKMRAVLIDDEHYALQGLKMRLDEIGGIEVVGSFKNGKQALENIEELRPDIVFLDIEMPTISGIELFSQILDIVNDVKIVFTTAFTQYAVDAFELNALDYIVKPVETERLLKTMERFKVVKPSATKGVQKTEVNCFRKLSVIVDGAEVNLGLRKKSEELLAYLICAEGEFVSKEKIMEALWPEAEKDKAANNLYVAFYNLKRYGVDTLTESLESARGKMRMNPEQIVCDLYEFKKLVRLCGSVNGETIGTARKAVELFRGALFEENYYDWTALPQAELDVGYLELLEKAVAYCKRIDDAAGMRYFEKKKEKFESIG
ncbi:MAG: response regulator [Clostridia bacterium]|nr:response regulator [Clostridia bacterium]